MTGLSVIVQRATQAGRLYPRYDVEAAILSLESANVRPWPYGVDVDGRLVFDIDRERVLANCDLHIGKDRWRVSRDIEWPHGAEPGDIVFSNATLLRKSFSLPLMVTSNPDEGIVCIEIGESKHDRLIELSDRCIALLANAELAGFVSQL